MPRPKPRWATTPGDSPPGGRRLRRFGYVPRRKTGLRERLVPPFTAPGPQLRSVLGIPPALTERLLRWSVWGGPLLVTLVAGVLRFWDLGSPQAVIFDETYYAKDAWALIHHGYEGKWPEDINDADPRPSPHIQRAAATPAYVVHPPVGKWIIGVGE